MAVPTSGPGVFWYPDVPGLPSSRRRRGRGGGGREREGGRDGKAWNFLFSFFGGGLFVSG